MTPLGSTLGYVNVDPRGRVSLKKYLKPDVRIVKVSTLMRNGIIIGLEIEPAEIEMSIAERIDAANASARETIARSLRSALTRPSGNRDDNAEV